MNLVGYTDHISCVYQVTPVSQRFFSACRDDTPNVS